MKTFMWDKATFSEVISHCAGKTWVEIPRNEPRDWPVAAEAAGDSITILHLSDGTAVAAASDYHHDSYGSEFTPDDTGANPPEFWIGQPLAGAAK